MFDTEHKKLIATRIKTLRKSKNLSHQTLANELTQKYNIKISKDSLIQYEITDEYHAKWDKVKGMNIEYLYCIADYFKVSTDYLLGNTPNPTQNKNLDAVCNYTGLSEQAVNMLHKLADNYTNDDDKSPITKDELQNLKNKSIKILEILNYLLANTENRNLFDSLSMIEKYEKIYKEVICDAKVEYCKSVSDVSRYPIHFEDDLTFGENFAKNLRFAKSYYFDAIEYFKETMNLYVKSHISSQETEAVIRKIEGLNYDAEKEKRDYYEFLLYVQEGD